MQVHKSLDELPNFKNPVVTIGTFDGVHQGHQQIIEQLKKEAKIVNGETVIISFYPHPRKIVSTYQPSIKILSTLQEKIELLTAKGIDHLIITPFDTTFAEQTPEAYIENFLVKKFNPYMVIIGYDHKFGKGRQGNYQLLEEYGNKLGFKVKEIPEHVTNEVIVSSTKIREAVYNHDIETARNFLGYDYFFEGTVIEGDKIGRTLGYPTANLKIEDEEKLLPADGIYAVEAAIEQAIYKGMMSIGFRPTVNGKNRTIEVNLFDFNKNIYGKKIRVFIKHFIRPEEKFNSLEALKKKIDEDKQISLQLLADN